MVLSKSSVYLVSSLLFLFATNETIYGTLGLQQYVAFQIYNRNAHKLSPSLSTKNCLFSTSEMNAMSINCNSSIFHEEKDKNTSRVYMFKNQAARFINNHSRKIDTIDSHEEKIKFITSTLLDYDLLNRTIEEWRRPLPKNYISSPLVLVGKC